MGKKISHKKEDTRKHGHCHGSDHDREKFQHSGKILTIRSYSGLSGDMFLSGLLRMAELSANRFFTP